MVSTHFIDQQATPLVNNFGHLSDLLGVNQKFNQGNYLYIPSPQLSLYFLLNFLFSLLTSLILQSHISLASFLFLLFLFQIFYIPFFLPSICYTTPLSTKTTTQVLQPLPPSTRHQPVHLQQPLAVTTSFLAHTQQCSHSTHPKPNQLKEGKRRTRIMQENDSDLT